MVAFNRTDLDYVLKQIQMAEAGQPPVNPHLAFGLREVAGTNNNAVPGQETLGSADQPFPRVGTPVFQTVTVNIDDSVFDPHPGVAGDTMTTSYQQVSVDPTANPFADPVGAGFVVDPAPRIISNLISDQSSNNPAAVAAEANFAGQLGDGYTILPSNPPTDDPDNLFIGNITPDSGLSAPFNTWMTFFGQFFDHGLDLVTKGGSGTVFIPLQADDPLFDKGVDGIAGTADDGPNFMVETRATNLPGPDGVLGTADDIQEGTNTTTPFVDQNQTYASDPSHQVFLRAYQTGVDGHLHSTGKLLEGHHPDGTIGGMATWADTKANALKLGILLTDKDVDNVPLLATDAYGNFIAGAHGFAQVVVKHADGSTTLVEGTGAGLDLAHPDLNDPTATVARTGHAFINDMAYNATPVFDSQGNLVADQDAVAGNAVAVGSQGQNLEYDNELLDAHYIAGDGRVNENIGLTAVHEVFHSEHNRLIDQVKDLIRGELANGDSSFASNWVLPGADLTNGIQDEEWNGERLFQVAKFGTETQYQHLVFEEFARKIAPTIHLFGNTDLHLDPAITAEFAHAVYRFGHSMLDETLPRFELNADGTNSDIAVDGTQIGLLEAFTNPLEYLQHGADAAGQIVQGTTHQIGSEIDEFVTGTLRNSLLGLPLDLAALNIARGRDTGVPPINLLRAQLYDATHDSTLKPYDSWYEFGQFLKHPASLINFVAAYGTEASISSATTLVDKRAAALALVAMGQDPASQTGDADHQNAYNFMHSLGAYANDVANPLSVHGTWSTGSITGLDNVDLWIGGLAEKQNLFGGLLGSTFNFIFETQLENLQDADRLYYLPRIEGIHFGSEIEANSFAELIMQNTGTHHLPGNIFMTPEYVVEAKDVTDDPATWLRNPVTGALLVEKLADGTVHFIGDDNFLGNTIVLGGTDGDDRLISGHADDDTVWGDGGNDFLDGGNGNDIIFGGTGNDTVRDSAGDDIIHGDAGNDDLDGGIGDDTIFGGDGNDLINGGHGIDDILGGLGNDIIFGGEDDDELQGNEGDDWMDGGLGGDILVGDQGAPTGDVPWISGNDVLDGGQGGDRMQGFSGDDIMLGLGGFDKFEGRLGFDWADFEQETHGVSVDMARREFVDSPLALGGDAIRDFFIETEAVSGSAFNDFLLGTNDAKLDPFNELDNVNLIFGLDTFFPAGPVAFSGGNIMLGGGGSDIIEGRGGNDIIDGDAWLHVELTRDANGHIFPGSEIVREILVDNTPGSIDTAVFSDVMSNYQVDLTPDAQGFFTVTHLPVGGGGGGGGVGGGGGGGGGGGVTGLGIDGVDHLRNIERLQFSDQTLAVDPFAPGANQVPSGSVLIQGDTDPAVAGVDPVVGSVLTADTTNLFDFDFINGNITTPIHFQWQYQDVANGDWTNIVGATRADFTPTTFFDTIPLRVQASFTDALGFTEIVNSAPTNPVALPAGVNTAPVVVAQQALVGIPDTQALQDAPFSYFLPLTAAFADQQTLANQLIYTATLANGQVLDGSAAAFGLTFTVIFDDAGAVTSGLVSGTPPAGFSGAIDVRVTATDRGPGTPLAVTDTFTVKVLHVNQPPVAGPDTYTTTEDVTLIVNTAAAGVLANDSDPENAPLTALLSTNPANGTVVLNPDGTFTYTPNANFGGTDTFTYRAKDGLIASPATAVTINVTPVDDGSAPITISGFPASGQTLTATLGADPDGTITSSTFQWLRDGTAIAGATAASLLLTADDVGHAISVTSVYTDSQAFNDTATSAATELVGQTFTGTAAANTFNGTAFSDLLIGLGGNDTLNGLAGNDRLEGGIGNDILDGGAGNDLMIGGAGNDTYVVDSAGDVVVENPAEGTDTVNTTLNSYTPPANVENLTFTGTGNFSGIGNSLNNTINGGAGDDTLSGGDGNDTLNGNGGNDNLTGDIGDDTLNGGAGDDTLQGGIGNDRLNGGAGVDMASYAGETDAMFVDLAAGTAQRGAAAEDILVSIENVTGGAGDDTIGGNNAVNRLDGGDGNDTLSGLGGADTLNGGLGNDTFIYNIGNGADIVDGGDGSDTLNITGTAAANTLNVIYDGASITQFAGGAVVGVEAVTADLQGGTDVLTYAGSTADVTVDLAANAASGFTSITNIENVTGGLGNDVLTGDGAINILSGGAGNDTFDGGVGADTLIGGTGDDIFITDGGDTLTEGAGAGTDTVRSSASFTLANNFENLTLTGTGDINGTGNTVANQITGNDGINTLEGRGGNDTINAGGGDDVIVYNAGDGHDIIDGGLENAVGDTFVVNGNATAEAFRVYTRAEWAAVAGNDVNSLAAATEIVVTRNGTDFGSIISELTDIEEIQINTNAGNDTVQAIGDFSPTSLNFNTITINGSSGNDTVDISHLTSAHRIVFTSHGGNDTIIGTLRPQDVVDLTSGSTTAQYHSTANTDGTMTMSNGSDSITYASSGAPTLSLPSGGNGDNNGSGGSDSGDHAGSGSDQTGTSQTDVLIGTAGDDNLVAFAGDDVAIGHAGADAISGGDGVDFLNGGEGRDVIFAGAGDDVVFGGSDADMIYGDAGADRIFGDQGNDFINAGAGDDTVFGGAGNDLIVAEIGDGNDAYFGDNGDGGIGVDTLDMSAATVDVNVNLGNGLLGIGSASSTQTGNDTLWGIENVNTGSGNDTITASNAVNVMNGGAGNDTFVFGSAAAANGDTIVGFEPGDHIDLSGIDANAGMTGDQNFTLTSGTALTAAGQLAVSYETHADGEFTVVQGNIDANSGADFKIEIEGHQNLTNSNFHL